MNEIRKINDFKDAIWFDDPTKFDYVRETRYACANVNFRCGGKIQFEKYGWKLIGMTIPKRINGSNRSDYQTFEGLYWWRKPQDDIKSNWCDPFEAVKFITEGDKIESEKTNASNKEAIR